MITLESCKKTLNSGKIKYTIEEVKQIREYLYFLVGLQLESEKLSITNN